MEAEWKGRFDGVSGQSLVQAGRTLTEGGTPTKGQRALRPKPALALAWASSYIDTFELNFVAEPHDTAHGDNRGANMLIDNEDAPAAPHPMCNNGRAGPMPTLESRHRLWSKP
ncbi:hypothetical protein HaLaN_02216 [Haematococcus lacustris]|uniref:Uncharacterized protein n=1 Tax=Haematococcus lacustris TaxID=44745 RepID=A0A699YDD7_HAELA|nr:hypothetical protein HaLaN_02216 [Haematococcus lacustris]